MYCPDIEVFMEALKLLVDAAEVTVTVVNDSTLQLLTKTEVITTWQLTADMLRMCLIPNPIQ